MSSSSHNEINEHTITARFHGMVDETKRNIVLRSTENVDCAEIDGPLGEYPIYLSMDTAMSMVPPQFIKKHNISLTDMFSEGDNFLVSIHSDVTQEIQDREIPEGAHRRVFRQRNKPKSFYVKSLLRVQRVISRSETEFWLTLGIVTNVADERNVVVFPLYGVKQEEMCVNLDRVYMGSTCLSKLPRGTGVCLYGRTTRDVSKGGQVTDNSIILIQSAEAGHNWKSLKVICQVRVCKGEMGQHDYVWAENGQIKALLLPIILEDGDTVDKLIKYPGFVEAEMIPYHRFSGFYWLVVKIGMMFSEDLTKIKMRQKIHDTETHKTGKKISRASQISADLSAAEESHLANFIMTELSPERVEQIKKDKPEIVLAMINQWN